VVAFLGAEIRSGAAAVAEATGLEARIHAADIVITGEGRLDGQTEFGKGPQYVAQMCRQHATPVACVAGCLGPGYEHVLRWFDVVESTTEAPSAMLPPPDVAAREVGEAAVRAVRLLLDKLTGAGRG
jgi:glycerate kinase